MALLFSAVTATANDHEVEFLVGGIPREFDDLEGWTAFDRFTEDIDEETEVSVRAEAYLYGEGETVRATPEEVAYIKKRMDTSDVDSFIEELNVDSELSYRVANPPDRKGGCSVNCYVIPKEMCWMPWKKRYDSSNIYDFPELKIHSAVDKCTYNFIEYGDVCYELPSAPIREILKIADTDGYLFYDRDKQIKAASISVGERWRTQQCYLLVDKALLQDVEQSGNTLLWIMREDRRENGKAKERFGDFYVEKDCSYVGSFRNEEFVVTQIFPRKGRKVDVDGADDPLSDILDQYGYRTETSEHTGQIAIQEVEESLL